MWDSLEEYLKELEECPDKELKERMGMMDNFPILMKANFEDLLRYIEGTGNYRLNSALEYPDHPGWLNHHFFSKKGGVSFQVMNFPSQDLRGTDLWPKVKDCTVTVSFHFAKRKDGLSYERAMAMAVKEIGEYILQKGIPCCLAYMEDHDGTLGFQHPPGWAVPG